MTQIQLTEPVDERTFQTGLTEFLRIAKRNDVTVERAWECRASAGADWEVDVVRLLSEESVE